MDDQGDGIRSFIATVLALLVGGRPVLLLDEPEAFLHPPQALQLGTTIVEQASNDRQIVVATHSVDLLRGILNRRTDVGVVRPSRDGVDAKTTMLSAEEVQEMANDPLLSSTRILDGLFYKGVVVVEADSDSAFYQRVARMKRPGDEIHYAHAHNKQTLYKVVEPYEKMGVKVVAVADFDILKRADEFKRLLEAKADDPITEVMEAQEQIRLSVEGAPLSEKLTELRSSLENLAEQPSDIVEGREAETLAGIKRRVKRALEESDAWSACKQEGREALSEPNKVAFDVIDTFCRERGLLIVPVGELESWLVPLGLSRSNNKNAWIVRALQTLAKTELPPDSKQNRFVEDIHNYLQ